MSVTIVWTRTSVYNSIILLCVPEVKKEINKTESVYFQSTASFFRSHLHNSESVDRSWWQATSAYIHINHLKSSLWFVSASFFIEMSFSEILIWACQRQIRYCNICLEIVWRGKKDCSAWDGLLLWICVLEINWMFSPLISAKGNVNTKYPKRSIRTYWHECLIFTLWPI